MSTIIAKMRMLWQLLFLLFKVKWVLPFTTIEILLVGNLCREEAHDSAAP